MYMYVDAEQAPWYLRKALCNCVGDERFIHVMDGGVDVVYTAQAMPVRV